MRVGVLVVYRKQNQDTQPTRIHKTYKIAGIKGFLGRKTTPPPKKKTKLKGTRETVGSINTKNTTDQ